MLADGSFKDGQGGPKPDAWLQRRSHLRIDQEKHSEVISVENGR
jgi:hypothetical protein